MANGPVPPATSPTPVSWVVSESDYTDLWNHRVFRYESQRAEFLEIAPGEPQDGIVDVYVHHNPTCVDQYLVEYLDPEKGVPSNHKLLEPFSAKIKGEWMKKGEPCGPKLNFSLVLGDAPDEKKRLVRDLFRKYDQVEFVDPLGKTWSETLPFVLSDTQRINWEAFSDPVNEAWVSFQVALSQLPAPEQKQLLKRLGGDPTDTFFTAFRSYHLTPRLSEGDRQKWITFLALKAKLPFSFEEVALGLTRRLVDLKPVIEGHTAEIQRQKKLILEALKEIYPDHVSAEFQRFQTSFEQDTLPSLQAGFEGRWGEVLSQSPAPFQLYQNGVRKQFRRTLMQQTPAMTEQWQNLYQKALTYLSLYHNNYGDKEKEGDQPWVPLRNEPSGRDPLFQELLVSNLTDPFAAAAKFEALQWAYVLLHLPERASLEREAGRPFTLGEAKGWIGFYRRQYEKQVVEPAVSTLGIDSSSAMISNRIAQIQPEREALYRQFERINKGLRSKAELFTIIPGSDSEGKRRVREVLLASLQAAPAKNRETFIHTWIDTWKAQEALAKLRGVRRREVQEGVTEFLALRDGDQVGMNADAYTGWLYFLRDLQKPGVEVVPEVPYDLGEALFWSGVALVGSVAGAVLRVQNEETTHAAAAVVGAGLLNMTTQGIYHGVDPQGARENRWYRRVAAVVAGAAAAFFGSFLVPIREESSPTPDENQKNSVGEAGF